MKPRQPYRSPFWTPDTVDATRGSAPAEPKGATEFSHRTRDPMPTAPAHRRAERPAQEPTTPYAQTDLALFGKLMAFGNRAEAVGPTQATPPTQRAPAAAPTRPADSVRGGSSVAYSSRDASLFQSLEAAFPGTGQPATAIRPAAAGAPEPPTRRYAPADLAAFDRLARYGRSA